LALRALGTGIALRALREVAEMENGANKLFHVLVVVGASLTGVGCGGALSEGSVDAEAAKDAALDGKSDGPYVGISPPPCGPPVGCSIDAGSDAYVHIAPNLDAGGADAYVHIAPNPDAGSDVYVGISPGIIDAGGDAYPPIVPPPQEDGYPNIR
jgi:hypothetical protein